MFTGFSLWSHLWDSNPRPADYKWIPPQFITFQKLTQSLDFIGFAGRYQNICSRTFLYLFGKTLTKR